MRLSARSQIETRCRVMDGPQRFRIIVEDERGVWHDGPGGVIDPESVSGPLRIIRLVKHVPPPSAADLLDDVQGDDWRT